MFIPEKHVTGGKAHHAIGVISTVHLGQFTFFPPVFSDPCILQTSVYSLIVFPSLDKPTTYILKTTF